MLAHDGVQSYNFSNSHFHFYDWNYSLHSTTQELRVGHTPKDTHISITHKLNVSLPLFPWRLEASAVMFIPAGNECLCYLPCCFVCICNCFSLSASKRRLLTRMNEDQLRSLLTSISHLAEHGDIPGIFLSYILK